MKAIQIHRNVCRVVAVVELVCHGRLNVLLRRVPVAIAAHRALPATDIRHMAEGCASGIVSGERSCRGRTARTLAVREEGKSMELPGYIVGQSRV
jgi:hypothetical protein